MKFKSQELSQRTNNFEGQLGTWLNKKIKKISKNELKVENLKDQGSRWKRWQNLRVLLIQS